MILDLLGGFIIICIMILVGYVASLAITFWFLALPLVAAWIWWAAKHAQKHPRPPISAHAQSEIDRFVAKEEVYRQIAKKQKAEGRRR